MVEALSMAFQNETRGPSTSRPKSARAPFAQDGTGMAALRVVVEVERAMVLADC